MSISANASITSEQDALDKGATEAALWVQKIQKQLKDEDDWRKEAQLAVAVFEASSKASGISYRRSVFNIFHSNVQTMVPAAYGSTPIPDVRRRFGDKDQMARLGAQIAERCIQSSIDCYDFDHAIKRAVRSACITGRGQIRVRYEPHIGTDIDPDGAEYEVIKHEEARIEHVPWDRFVAGPAQTWELTPWVAFKHDLSLDELSRLMDPGEAQLPEPPQPTGDPTTDAALADNHQAQTAKATADHADKRKEYEQRLLKLSIGSGKTDSHTHDGSTKASKGIIQTMECWEVWDRLTKSVIWVAESDTELPLQVFPDPMRFAHFFPVPRPLTHTDGESSMTPVCPYSVYKDLIDEIDDVTRRIKVVIDDMRVRAIADPKMQKDLEDLAKAVDGEVVTTNSVEPWVSGGKTGIANMVMFWPNDQNVQMLKALMEHREAIKQVIYEVTGLSDIMRGATNASETATAQQIKATWGSQRIQELQMEVQRFAREAFRLIAETIFTHFGDDTIRSMTLLPEPIDPSTIQVPPPQPQMDPTTGQPLPPDPQQQQMAQQQALQQAQAQADDEFNQALQMMRSDLAYYRVDIETDSTIKADMAQSQQQFSNFVQAAGQFSGAMAQTAQVLPAIVPHLTEIFCAFLRKQKLGKNIEDVLDSLIEAAQQPPTPQQGGPDPNQEAQMAQVRDQEAAAQHQRDMEKEQAVQQTQQVKNQGVGMKAQAEVHKSDNEAMTARLMAAMPRDALGPAPTGPFANEGGMNGAVQ